MSKLAVSVPALRWLLISAIILAVLTVGFGGAGVMHWLVTLGLGKGATAALGMGSVTLACTVTFIAVFWRMYVRHMRRALGEMGYEVCLSCGYWLRGLDEDIDRCPECGRQREPRARDQAPVSGTDQSQTCKAASEGPEHGIRKG